MATDRQTPCLYYVCAGLCKKGRKADHAHYCQHCNKYKPRARIRYKNQKKEKLEKIRKEERYQIMDIHNFQLNDIFQQNAREFCTRPVMAMKYQPGLGIENGWMVYFEGNPSNKGVVWQIK